MDKLYILIIVLVSCGIVFMIVLLGIGIKSLLEGNWIYYVYFIIVLIIYLGNFVIVVVVVIVNIGLYIICYNIDIIIIVIIFFGIFIIFFNINVCVDLDFIGYISVGLFILDVYKFSS